MANELISQIPVHDQTPPASALMELLNQSGPTSEYCTLAEMLGTLHPTYLDGGWLSNDATNSNTVIDVANCVGASDDSSPVFMKLAALNKSISSTWAVGSGNGSLDVGAVLASTWYHVYEIMRPDTFVTDVLLSQAPPNTSASLTATSASPAVFTWAGGVALPFQNGCPFVLTGGTPPTGFSLNTVYYVVASSQAAGTFELSATQGGSAINSSSTGSSIVGGPAVQMPTSYTKKRRIGSIKTDGSSHILLFTQNADEFLWAAWDEDVNSATLSTSAALKTMTVPLGVKVNALIGLEMATGGQSYALWVYAPDAGIPTAAVASGTGFSIIMSGTNLAVGGGPFSYRTNTGGQIGFISNVTSGTYYVMTQGWIDRRGKM